MTTLIIIIAVAVLLVLWVVGIYNGLVNRRNNRENAFANIDVQLKQRHDLVPQLVATVKGYATHERELLERVTAARTAAMSAVGINDKIQTENALSSALVSALENKLAASRRFFNGATRDLNTAIETFPACLFAGMFGFHREPMFEIPAADRATLDKAPEIKF